MSPPAESRRSVHVVYRVVDTTANARFFADDSCITMTPHSTVLQLTGGTDEAGRRVRAAVYRDAYSVVVYEAESGDA